MRLKFWKSKAPRALDIRHKAAHYRYGESGFYNVNIIYDTPHPRFDRDGRLVWIKNLGMGWQIDMDTTGTDSLPLRKVQISITHAYAGGVFGIGNRDLRGDNIWQTKL